MKLDGPTSRGIATVWKLLLVAGAVVIVAIVALVISVELYHRSGPPSQERRAREVALKPLLESHANREQVVQALGLEFVDFTNRQWLERSPHERLRLGGARYPGVLYHTTMDTMTWLFFDSDGRLQDYYLCEQ